MKKFSAHLIVLFIITISACSTARNESSKTNNFIVNKEEKVSGLNLHEYANVWWQWTRTMSKQESPLIDRTGEQCHVNQFGGVWFLAGGYGSSRISRKCTIPEGKYIFFPVINMVYWSESEVNYNCDEIKRKSALNNDKLLVINVTLDGENIPEAKNFRLKSEKCFDLLGLIKRNQQHSTKLPAATDGYWLMLKPLPKGHHKLSFYAQYNRYDSAYGQMAQDIEYEIEVK